MENNTDNNMGNDVLKKKKHPIITILIILAIIAIVAIVVLKKTDTKFIDQSDSDLEQALEADSTTSINQNLDDISLENTNDQDLMEIDQELQNL